jgi:hypothetical protein
MGRERRQMRRQGNETENKNNNTPTRMLEDKNGNMVSDGPGGYCRLICHLGVE